MTRRGLPAKAMHYRPQRLRQLARHRFAPLSLVVALATLVGLLGAPAHAAKPSKSSAEDRPPELISKTGGGGTTWSDVKELAAAAKQGIPQAMAQYGELLLLGDRVPKDVPAGLTLLETAARAGQGSAAFRLGRVFDDGVLAGRDRAKAHRYYRAASAVGVGEASFNLGAAYSSGRGVRRDYAEGLAWLIRARTQGIVNDGESQLRTRLAQMKRPDLVAAGEARATEIERELTSASLIELIEGKPLVPTAVAPATPAPVIVAPSPAPIRPPAVDLRPAPLAPISLPTPTPQKAP